MKVITFSQKVTVTTHHGEFFSEITCNPGERLIFDDDNAVSIQTKPGSATYMLEVSDLDAMLRERPPLAHYKKRRVLFYRNRGHGDQLIASALPRFFREVLGADARQLSDKVHESLWMANPYILGAPLSFPIHIDSVWRAKGRPFFDQAFFIESATEWDQDSEQPNVYDRLFAFCGIDPERVPAKYKRPVFIVSGDDQEACANWFGKVTGKDWQPYIIVQLRAANKSTATVLQAVNDLAAKKGLLAFITDTRPWPDELAEISSRLPHLINVIQKIPSIRLFGALIAGARLVVGPDSSALHFAAANETPALGIWGPFSPECRAKYYPRQAHIWHQEACLNAPCFNFMPELPTHKCPQGAKQQACECFEGVTYDEVFGAMLDVMQ